MKHLYVQTPRTIGAAVLTLAMLFVASSAYSQNGWVTIGTGTSTNDQWSYPAPYGNYYWGAKHQILIRASELTAEGAVAGNITQVGFYVETPSGTALQGLTINMGHTLVNDLTTIFETGLTTVYTTTSFTDVNGWNDHTLTTPFTWNGTMNIVVEVCFNNTSWTSNSQMRYSNAGFNACSYYYADQAGVCAQLFAAMVENKRPNIRLYAPLCSSAPTAEFSATPQNTCVGGTVNFTDESLCLPTSWSWTFPGGTPSTSNAPNPTVTYGTAGTYDVTLIATNSSGSDTITKTNFISVNSLCPINIGTSTTYNDQYTYPAPYGNWYWGARHQMLIKASEILAAGGTAGLLNSVAFNVAQVQGTPLQGFTMKIAFTSLTTLTSTFETTGFTTVYGPATYTETAGWNVHTFSSPVFWNGSDNIIVEVCFNNTSYTLNASTYYSNAGFNACTYVFQDASGVCGLTSGIVTSSRPNMQLDIVPCSGPPLVNFSGAPIPVCAGDTVSFTDLSGCTPTSWSWTFPGGTPGTSTAQNPSIIYNTPGTYDVTLTASNGSGSDSLTKTAYITVTGAPVADFTSNVTITCPGGGAVNFTDLSTNCPTSWSWSFPGGTPSTSTSQNPSVSYGTAGTYDVTLIATNSTGSDTLTMPGYISVQATCPLVIGTGTTTNDQWSYPAPYGNWYWGAKHQILVKASEITAAGGSAGMLNSVGFQVQMPQGVPLTGFYIKVDTTSLTSLTTTFEPITGGSSYGPSTYTETSGWNDHFLSAPLYWDGSKNILIEVCFNNSSYTYNAVHYLSDAGFSAVNYYFQDASGVCSVPTGWTTTNWRPNLRMYLNPCSGAPQADFIADSMLSCTGGTVQFTDESTCLPTSWLWTFPGGTPGTSTSQNPSVTYSSNGTYDVTLIATNANGSDTIVKPGFIVVSGAPIPGFVAMPTMTTVGATIDFADLSTCGPTSWTWSFPGGTPSTSTAQNPTDITYSAVGTYDVTLIVTNSNGSRILTKPDYITITDNMVVDSMWSIVDLVNMLLGPGVTASNITSNCHPNARGYFAGGGTGLADGLIMSSGDIANAPGPNSSCCTTDNLMWPGDAFLTTWSGFTTFDACVIEFDVDFICDSLSMTYVFGTEEYNDYVGSSYNDIFGFFVSGGGFPLPTNFAWVPGTVATPITVNTVNNGPAPSGTAPTGPCVNCGYHVNNDPATNNSIEFDGYTTVLKSGTLVVPGVTYHLKLAISDASDPLWNAMVLIKKGSIETVEALGCQVILDVDLVSIGGTPYIDFNKIEWTTANEHNIARYDVQRSYDATNWETIGSVPALGNAVSADYVFDDYTFTKSLSYYRLEMFDAEGYNQYSPVVAVRNTDAILLELISIGSDKDGGLVDVTFSSSTSGPVQVTLSNLIGQVIVSETVVAVAGANKVTLSVPDRLDMGVYLLGLDMNDTHVGSKFIH